jgi:predicted transposase/invertase (TIGR01784 family)
MEERLDPLNDYLFLKYMGEKGDEEQLLAFLNATLKRTGKDNLKSVEIVGDRNISAEVIGDKASILDVRALTDDKTHVNIEVQLRNYDDMDKRSLFYWSRDFSKGLEAGQGYKDSPNIIAINIVNYEFLPKIENFHTSFHLREDEINHILTQSLEIHFIDMVKFRRLHSTNIQEPLHRWLKFFDKNTKPEILEEVINMDTAIQKAEEKIRYVSNNKEALRAYHMREMAMFDFTSAINSAERKGKMEGKLEIAMKLKALNIPFSLIQDSTGLAIDEIERL